MPHHNLSILADLSADAVFDVVRNGRRLKGVACDYRTLRTGPVRLTVLALNNH